MRNPGFISHRSPESTFFQGTKTLNDSVSNDDGFLQVVDGSIYDWPRYYDFIYGADWKAETDFLNDCLHRFAKKRSGRWRLFEPACGTGRLLYRLAKQGHDVGGIDLNEHAVGFCNRRLEKAGFPGSVVQGDMCDFKLKKPCDAAFNTINSFRHLKSDAQAIAHLNCMADAIRPDGFYALGFHVTPVKGEADEEEHWTQRRGYLQINTSMWLLQRGLKKRVERFALVFDVYTPTSQFRIRDEFNFRTYTARQFVNLLRKVSRFEVAAVFDFAYKIDRPIKLDGSTQDAVFILKRI